MKKKTIPGSWALAVTGCAFVALAVLSTYSWLTPTPSTSEASAGIPSGEKAAAIHVNEGSGWLSTGEDLQIAEWYSGSGKASDYFANFRGSEGGATVDLRFSGLGRAGTFSCAEPTAVGASMELRVDVNNAYFSTTAGDCRVTVTRFDGDVVEGTYQATLTHAGDASDQLTISGNFRSTRPRPERVSSVTGPRVAGL